MNKIIKEQLNLCRVAKVPEFTDDTVSLKITRGDTVSDVLELNSNYLIEVEDWVLSTSLPSNIADGWNHGTHIQSKYLKCTPTQFQGKMIRFDAVGFDEYAEVDKQDVYLELWLSRNAFKIIKKLDN